MAESKKLKKDVLAVLKKFFGEETLRLFNNFYKAPDEIMRNADKMLSSLIGAKNSSHYLSPIYKKYKIKVKK